MAVFFIYFALISILSEEEKTQQTAFNAESCITNALISHIESQKIQTESSREISGKLGEIWNEIAEKYRVWQKQLLSRQRGSAPAP